MGLFTRAAPAAAAWEELALPWRSAFSLAWEAYRVRTVPVGAVLVDGAGRVVARGRNHVYGDTGAVLGGVLAHAEVVALARLSPTERHEDLTLYTTHEPCSLCVGAATAATIGSLHYAGSDPYAGAAASPLPANPHVRRLPLAMVGPLPGPFGLLASVLPVELFLRINPDGHLVKTYRAAAPDVVEAAEALLASDVLRRASGRRSRLDSVLPQIWDVLRA